MVPKETPMPIPIFRPVLPLVAPSAVEVVVDDEEDEEAEGILAVDRLAEDRLVEGRLAVGILVGMLDRVDDIVIKSLL